MIQLGLGVKITQPKESIIIRKSCGEIVPIWNFRCEAQWHISLDTIVFRVMSALRQSAKTRCIYLFSTRAVNKNNTEQHTHTNISPQTTKNGFTSDHHHHHYHNCRDHTDDTPWTKEEQLLGYSASQRQRIKALHTLGLTEATFDRCRAVFLSSLGYGHADIDETAATVVRAAAAGESWTPADSLRRKHA